MVTRLKRDRLLSRTRLSGPCGTPIQTFNPDAAPRRDNLKTEDNRRI
jgi:hypothetical protein